MKTTTDIRRAHAGPDIRTASTLPGVSALAAAALALVASLPGCAAPSEPPWETIDADALDPARQEQLAEADAARKALFGALLEELTGAMSEGGPSAAIAVCSTRAPALAAQVSQDRGLSIGRTSFRLRNPHNAPPPWARAAVDERADTRRLFASDAGDLGVLHPILMADACLTCHGPADALAPGVRATLAERYPDDRATGFAAGDLRGWFWVQVPAR